MSKSQVYVDAVKAVLTQVGGGPIRCGELFEKAKEQGLVPDVKYAYHYTLKAAKTSPEFDTSKRGWVSLATENQPVAEVKEEVSDFVAVGQQVV